jgi:hypothetical protein
MASDSSNHCQPDLVGRYPLRRRATRPGSSSIAAQAVGCPASEGTRRGAMGSCNHAQLSPEDSPGYEPSQAYTPIWGQMPQVKI